MLLIFLLKICYTNALANLIESSEPMKKNNCLQFVHQLLIYSVLADD